VTPAIEAIGLTKSFGSFVAVDGVDFTIGPGEVVGLLGANGAGKTTTIRMLAGLIAPTVGTARLLGGPPNRTTRRALGYVPQGLGLYGDLTVRQNLEFSASAYGVEPAALPEQLDRESGRLVADLPLGLQRQLAFAVASQHRPRVMILDEPTSGVELLAAAHLWDEMRQSAEAGAGLLVSTHSMQEARRCDRLLVMAAGMLVARGREADIVRDTSAVEVSSPSWSNVFEALSETSAIVTLAGRSVRVVDQPLEQIRAVLDQAGIAHQLTTVTATIDETMAVLDRSMQVRVSRAG